MVISRYFRGGKNPFYFYIFIMKYIVVRPASRPSWDRLQSSCDPECASWEFNYLIVLLHSYTIYTIYIRLHHVKCNRDCPTICNNNNKHCIAKAHVIL